MKMKMKKFGKISSILEFSISKWKFSWKSEVWKSSLTISLFNFNYLPNEGVKKVDAKNEDEDEKKLEEWIWFLNSPYHN